MDKKISGHDKIAMAVSAACYEIAGLRGAIAGLGQDIAELREQLHNDAE